jgi:stage II sporulation protein D
MCVWFVISKNSDVTKYGIDKDKIDKMTVKALEKIGYLENDSKDNSMETMKALAIVIRTNYVYGMLTNTLDETEQYMKKSYSGSEEKSAYKAVEATKDMVITYNDQIVYAFFHRVSPLKTNSGGIEYLKEVECPRDIESEDYINIEYVVKDSLTGKIEMVEESNFEGRISVEPYVADDKYVRIVSKGVGDGMGLSIYDAYKEAEKGKDYVSILKKYYKNIVLKKVCYE